VDFVTVTGFRGFREFRFLGRPLYRCKIRAAKLSYAKATNSWERIR